MIEAGQIFVVRKGYSPWVMDDFLRIYYLEEGSVLTTCNDFYKKDPPSAMDTLYVDVITDSLLNAQIIVSVLLTCCEIIK